MLHERKVESGHGDGVVRQLSVDLKERYPKMGLSPRNIWYMKRFYLRYCGSDVKVQRSVALLPWSHNVYLLGKNLDDSGQMHHALLSPIETDSVLTKGKVKGCSLNGAPFIVSLNFKFHVTHHLLDNIDFDG